jgi:hypothetical protein
MPQRDMTGASGRTRSFGGCATVRSDHGILKWLLLILQNSAGVVTQNVMNLVLPVLYARLQVCNAAAMRRAFSSTSKKLQMRALLVFEDLCLRRKNGNA